VPIDPTLWLQRAQITISGVMRTSQDQDLAESLWRQPSPFGQDPGPAEARLWRDQIHLVIYEQGRRRRRPKKGD
jgi:hypothetical protein